MLNARTLLLNWLKSWIRRLPRSTNSNSVAVIDVVFDDRGVVCRRSDGKKESVAWSDLRSVEIMTTDQGPFVNDVFMVLHGSAEGCVVPQEAEGFGELLQRLQQLPDFDNAAVIAAMGCAANAVFPCWSRTEPRTETQGSQPRQGNA